MKRSTTTDLWRLSDERWEKIRLLLPEHRNTHRFGGGRPRKPDRVCADAIFFRLRTGARGRRWTPRASASVPLPTTGSRSGSEPACS
jgi:transposase